MVESQSQPKQLLTLLSRNALPLNMSLFSGAPVARYHGSKAGTSGGMRRLPKFLITVHMSSEDPLFILYISNFLSVYLCQVLIFNLYSDFRIYRKPKGVVHTNGLNTAGLVECGIGHGHGMLKAGEEGGGVLGGGGRFSQMGSVLDCVGRRGLLWAGEEGGGVLGGGGEFSQVGNVRTGRCRD